MLWSNETYKKKRDKDYERLVNKLNKIEADFNSEFKVFIGGDEEWMTIVKHL